MIVTAVPLVNSMRAVSLHRTCRKSGRTVGKLGDCQIAALALRLDVPVLHRDRDFETLAAYAGLRTVSLLGS